MVMAHPSLPLAKMNRFNKPRRRLKKYLAVSQKSSTFVRNKTAFKPLFYMSFIADRVKMDGLTFDDVLLIPAYSEVLPRDVQLRTKFSRNITLNVPIVSAAMDTVTEAPLAIAIAREGGIGVIHKNMSIEEQARQVKAVKRAENGMIYDPVTIHADKTVGDALAMMEEYHIGGIPVVDSDRKLVGIVTNRDLRFEGNMHRPVREVMTSENLITTSQSTDLEQAARILQEHKIEKLPVVDAEGHLVGLVTYKDITKAKDKPFACKDSRGRLRVAAGVGVTADSIQRVDALVAAGVDAIVIDTAHGHSRGVIGVLRAIKDKYPEIDVVVGNIATGDAARFLVDNGADGVKVGIGPGSICTTRVIAGVGVPQLSAVYDVAKTLEGTGIPLIAEHTAQYTAAPADGPSTGILPGKCTCISYFDVSIRVVYETALTAASTDAFALLVRLYSLPLPSIVSFSIIPVHIISPLSAKVLFADTSIRIITPPFPATAIAFATPTRIFLFGSAS